MLQPKENVSDANLDFTLQSSTLPPVKTFADACNDSVNFRRELFAGNTESALSFLKSAFQFAQGSKPFADEISRDVSGVIDTFIQLRSWSQLKELVKCLQTLSSADNLKLIFEICNHAIGSMAYTPLMWLCDKLAPAELIKEYLTLPQDINLSRGSGRQSRGVCAMHLAAIRGDAETILLLAHHGASGGSATGITSLALEEWLGGAAKPDGKETDLEVFRALVKSAFSISYSRENCISKLLEPGSSAMLNALLGAPDLRPIIIRALGEQFALHVARGDGMMLSIINWVERSRNALEPHEVKEVLYGPTGVRDAFYRLCTSVTPLSEIRKFARLVVDFELDAPTTLTELAKSPASEMWKKVEAIQQRLRDLTPVGSHNLTPGPFPYSVLKTHGNFEHLELALKAYAAATVPRAIPAERATFINRFLRYLSGDKESTRRELRYDPALTKLMPHLVSSYSDNDLADLSLAIEYVMDRRRELRGYHPYEAELLLALNHPHTNKLRRSSTDIIIAALTSITRFYENGIRNLPAAAVNNLARIGALTFLFQCWRFDALSLPQSDGKGKVESLLEKYGFERIAANGERGSPAGSGFVLRAGAREIVFERRHGAAALDLAQNERQFEKLDDKVTIEFRKKYISAWHPEIGKLIVINSSPEGGRLSFRHPAYFASPEMLSAYSEQEILNFSDADIEQRFNHILDYRLYYKVPDITRRTERLLDFIYGVKQSIAEWRCGTNFHTAYQDDWHSNKRVLMQGPYSPGFEQIVDFLERSAALAEKGQAIVPDLAFVRRDLPPWFPLRFRDSKGLESDRFIITPTALTFLSRFVRGSASPAEVEGSGFGAFIQSGLDNEAELVLLMPENSSKIWRER